MVEETFKMYLSGIRKNHSKLSTMVRDNFENYLSWMPKNHPKLSIIVGENFEIWQKSWKFNYISSILMKICHFQVYFPVRKKNSSIFQYWEATLQMAKYGLKYYPLLKLSTMVGEKLKFICLKLLKMHLNYPPWLKIFWKFATVSYG